MVRFFLAVVMVWGFSTVVMAQDAVDANAAAEPKATTDQVTAPQATPTVVEPTTAKIDANATKDTAANEGAPAEGGDSVPVPTK